MNDKSTGKKVRGFVQVSLPAEFAKMLREEAEAAGRSMAGQVEHWTEIGKRIETIAPGTVISGIKTAGNSSDILIALASFVANPSCDALKKQYQPSGFVYGTDPSHPGLVFRYNVGGTRTPGTFNKQNEFVPSSSSTKTKRTNVVKLLKLKPQEKSK